MKKPGILKRSDFISYLKMGGSTSFNKPLYLNKAQKAKLNDDQLMGREPVIIDGKEGYMNGDGAWVPKKTTRESSKETKK